MISSLHSGLPPVPPASPSEEVPPLEQIYEELNLTHFEGCLIRPDLRWNHRLRSSAGRFIPVSRRFWPTGHELKPTIEVAGYLLQEARARELIYDTMGHEM